MWCSQRTTYRDKHLTWGWGTASLLKDSHLKDARKSLTFTVPFRFVLFFLILYNLGYFSFSSLYCVCKSNGAVLNFLIVRNDLVDACFLDTYTEDKIRKGRKDRGFTELRCSSPVLFS